MSKCNFSKVALQITFRHGFSPVNLIHIFRTLFPKKTSCVQFHSMERNPF